MFSSRSTVQGISRRPLPSPCPLRGRPGNSSPAAVIILACLVVGGFALAWYLGVLPSFAPPIEGPEGAPQTKVAKGPTRGAPPEIEENLPASEALELVKKLAIDKNSNDPEANKLLAPMPKIPAEPVTPREAAALDAMILLHRDYYVKAIKSFTNSEGKKDPSRLVLVTRGYINSEPFQVRTDEGRLERSQRVMSNPDLIVEVRDGKIRGVEARLHVE